MIYIILLEQNKFYVGFSERPIGERFLEHFNNFGSKWTQIYRPLQVLCVLEGGKEEENDITLRLMDEYGWWNVRGGDWCHVEMNSCPSRIIGMATYTITNALAAKRSELWSKYDD